MKEPKEREKKIEELEADEEIICSGQCSLTQDEWDQLTAIRTEVEALRWVLE